MRNSPWWYSNANPFYTSGYGLPNCTCYAYGRYAEIKGTFADLPTRNADKWFDIAKNAFETGQSPQLGAVACWRGPVGGTYSGHVAVVEEIYDNGDFLASNSGYTRDPDKMESQYFFTYYCDKQSGYLGSGWMKRRNYIFQGFIYQSTPKSLPAGQWHAKRSGGYSRTSAEARDNAIKVYRQMTGYGWSLNAICGLLGNIEQECAYNFWQWENGIVSENSSAQNSARNNAYGFVQWTPASGYTKDDYCARQPGFGPNYSDKPGKLTDAEVQLWAIQNRTVPTGQWLTNTAPAKKYKTTLPWEQFKISTADPGYLSDCFTWEYERPAEATANLQRRRAAAQYWYDYFSGFAPPSPVTDSPQTEPPPYNPENEPVPDIPETPVITPSKPLEKIDAQWYAKNTGYYERDSNEAYNNACCIFNILWFDNRWSVKAVCALLGWTECFSDYNPFRWAGDTPQSSFIIAGSPAVGYHEEPNPYLVLDWCMYGLTQFSPASGYLDNAASREHYAPNFRNPVWNQSKDPLTGQWTLTIAGYSYTGVSFDGDAQISYFLEILPLLWTNPPDSVYSSLTLKTFLSRTNGRNIPWMVRAAAQCVFGLDTDDYRVEQAISAARYWYGKFRKYEPEKISWPTLYSGKHYLIRNGV